MAEEFGRRIMAGESPINALIVGLGDIIKPPEIDGKDIEVIKKLGVDHSIFDGLWERQEEFIDPETGKKYIKKVPICNEFNNGTPLGEFGQVLLAPIVWGIQYLLPQAYENAVDTDGDAAMLKKRKMGLFKRNPEDWAWYLTLLSAISPYYKRKKSEEGPIKEEKPGDAREEKLKEYFENHIPYMISDVLKSTIDYFGRTKYERDLKDYSKNIYLPKGLGG